MTSSKNLSISSFNYPSLIKHMLIGAGIGLFTIGLFLAGTGDYPPEWGKYWMIRPLVIVPIATAMGAAFFYFMGFLRQKGGWKKAASILLGIIGFIISLWLGMVLGLDGTYWN